MLRVVLVSQSTSGRKIGSSTNEGGMSLVALLLIASVGGLSKKSLTALERLCCCRKKTV